MELILTLISKSKTLFKEKIIFEGKQINPEILGLEILKKPLGTAYHTPLGTWIAYGPNNKRLSHLGKDFIDTRHISPTILDFFNLKRLKYMKNSLMRCK